jgi:predicted transcriptional regulator
MRTLIDLPEDDIAWLDQAARERGRSRAALVRDAVARYRRDSSGDAIDRAFGVWRNREDVGDGLAYQERLRREWDREPGGRG